MKMAAVHASADLAKEKVPEIVIKAYGGKDFSFGEITLFQTFDPRVYGKVAPLWQEPQLKQG